MVFSHLNSKLEYSEDIHIDPEDRDYETGLYDIEIFEKHYLIALGKPKYTFSLKYGIVYFPIYLIHEDKIKGKIGVFETEETRLPSIIDPTDHYVNPDILGEPLLFSKINSEYLEKEDLVYKREKEVVYRNEKKPIKELEEGEIDEDEEDDAIEEDATEEDDMFSVRKSASNKEESIKEKKEERISLKDVFIKDKTPPSNPTWPTETETDAKKYRKEYNTQKSANDNWVIQFMKNKNYNIMKNDGGGDCFFYTLRDAFEEIGAHTTVQKLRLFLSQEATVSQLEQLTGIYKDIAANIRKTEHEIEIIENANRALKKQTQEIQTQPDPNTTRMKELLESARSLHKDYQTLKLEKSANEELLQEFQYMENIKTLDDLKTMIRTSSYWADTWAISTLERLLEVKVIILEDSTDKDAVMRCGQLNEEISTFNPKYYIMVNYSGNNHYELITYKDKRIFTFSEIPYDIKILITNKCMEKMAGPYAIIPAFKQFHAEIGVRILEKESDSEKSEMKDLFDEDIVFIFHANSDKSKKAGKGVGEKIPNDRISEFEILGKKTPTGKTDVPWRQQLDDSWTGTPFTIDHERWNSVSHFLMALPFKKTEPKIYNVFSLDSESEISQDLEKAKLSISKAKERGGDQGKYYSIWKGLEKISPEDEEIARKEALFAKFTQNADLTTMLLNTKRAKLMHFQRGKDPMTDILLMTVRKKLSEK
jgi:hypothetical protein